MDKQITFYKFLFLPSGDITLNLGLIQRSPDKISTFWVALNKKDWYFSASKHKQFTFKTRCNKIFFSKKKLKILYLG